MNTNRSLELLTRSELQYIYSDHATPGDNPNIRGKEDRDFLSRHQSYEVLDYINAYALTFPHAILPHKDFALKLERLLWNEVPKNLHGRATITEWLRRNLPFYQYA